MTTREELIETLGSIETMPSPFVHVPVMLLQDEQIEPLADALLAAFPHIAEEPEWEWGVTNESWTHGSPVYVPAANLREYSGDRGWLHHRRRAPGPWEPVDQEPQESGGER